MSQDQDFPKRYNFKEIEAQCIQKWRDEKTYKFELTPEDTHDNIFSIDTPPPFTSGNLHMGHILNHAWIDFMARFRRLDGKKVYLPQGFDCHGLPTELKVQNNAGIDKNDRDLFLKTCHEWTEGFINDMKKQFDAIGYSTDWDYTYKTMDDSYVSLVQQSLLKFQEEGWLFRDKHPVHWCTKCETSLAKQEVGYVEKQGKIFEIKLPIHEGEGEFVTIATTRPEMMEACIAVFIHPKDFRYSHLSAARVDLPIANRTVPVLMDHAVDMNFGTGVVYCCTFGDETDIMWQKKHKLPIYTIITPNGLMTEDSVYKGMHTKKAQKQIVKDLDELGLLVSEKPFPHRVIVHTERSSCNNPIEYLPVPQWFIKVKDFTQEIKEDGLSMKWYPDLSRRLVDWCDALTWDWVVSRQRVFGTPFPFWYCSNMECDYVIPAKVENLPLDPMKVDAPEEKCPKCGSDIIGEKDVCDCWVDSSISPLRISKWKIDDEFFNKVYPTTVRPQGYEIIRTWLFYTLYRSKFLTGTRPFSEIMINGMVAGPDGRKMSKSFGNTVSPDEVLPYYGTDVVRQWAAMGALGDDYPFNYHWVRKDNPKQKVKKDKINQEKKRIVKGKITQEDFDALYRKDSVQLIANTKFLTKIWNANRLVWMNTEGLEISDLDYDPAALTAIDHFILSELNLKAKSIYAVWDKYQWRDGYTTFRTFFWNMVCDNYLEASKYRYKSEDAETKLQAVKLTLYIFFQLVKIISPILPFITEELYQRLYKQWDGLSSVHLSRWPTEVSGLDADKAQLGKIQIDAIAMLRNGKSKAKMALNKVLPNAALYVPADVVALLKDKLLPITETLKIENLEILPVEDYSAEKVPESAVQKEDEFTKWRIVIYTE